MLFLRPGPFAPEQISRGRSASCTRKPATTSSRESAARIFATVGLVRQLIVVRRSYSSRPGGLGAGPSGPLTDRLEAVAVAVAEWERGAVPAAAALAARPLQLDAGPPRPSMPPQV